MDLSDKIQYIVFAAGLPADPCFLHVGVSVVGRFWYLEAQTIIKGGSGRL
jgi:hypothetical protein